MPSKRQAFSSFKQVGRQRLARLARYLLTVPAARFDMTHWASEFFNQPNPVCNTTACAIGWATVLFKKEKFRLVKDTYSYWLSPEYRGNENWDAVALFFRIPNKIAEGLFGVRDCHYMHDPEQVAKNIKYFLRTGKVRV